MAKTLAPCQCSQFVAYNTESDVEYTTSCNAQTARTFAPGHDARLKGNLIRWAVLGYEIRVGDVTKSAEGWAEGFGFGYMVAAGIKRSAERCAAKAERTMKRIRKEVEHKAVAITAKVGRWTYEGVVLNGKFTYQNKKNEVVSTTKFVQI